MLDDAFGGHALIAIVALIYLGALAVSAPGTMLKKRGLERVGLVLLLLALALNTWIIADRWMVSGRPPFKTLFETLVFYPWCVGVVTLVLIGLHRLYFLIPFSSAVSIFGLGYALYKPDIEIINLPPALQSGWFVPHVVTYFVSYAGLFISFVLAGLALYVHHRRAGEDEGAEGGGWASLDLGRFAHHAAVFGIVTLTLGLVMGAAWGKFAWGDYWSWDPKENWALITWLAYMIYLHLRLVREWRGERALWVLVFAFGAVVFTYLGMNLLPSAQGSLHVYQ